MAQTTLQTFLCELHENCNLLKEREAKYDDLQAKFNTLNLELRDRGLIVMTMRADFYDRAVIYPNVAKVITHHQKLVERMNEKELLLSVDNFIFTLAGRLLLLGVAALILGVDGLGLWTGFKVARWGLRQMRRR
jgi:conflict system STAND superfamily ATPase